MSKGKILVTGGMGYIGSHTVVELIAAGYEPVIVDDLSNSDKIMLEGIEQITEQKVSFEQVDLSREAGTLSLFGRHKDALAVIHFAAFKAVGESVQQPTEYYRNNIQSLINVIIGMKQEGIKSLIFSSSCTVYGQPEVLPVTEQTPFQAAWSPYGYTKQVGEQLLMDETKANPEKLAAIALRYFNPIGAHPSGLIGELPNGIPNNLLPYITQTAIGIRKELSVFGSDYNTKDGTAVRDYIHVVDLAQAHVVACARLIEDKNKTAFEAFNLGTGTGFTVLDVIHSFEKANKLKINYKLVERRSGDIECIYADTTYAADELGWKTKLGIDDMTASSWQWEQNFRKKNS